MTVKGVSKKIRDLNPTRYKKPCRAYNRFDEYFNLLLNSVVINDKETGEALNYSIEDFVKNALFDSGQVGYDKIAKKFAYVVGEGINDEGKPTRLTFITANGKTWTRPACYDNNNDGAYIIEALPNTNITMSSLIKQTTDFMTNCDVAMTQNLDACKTPYIVVCKNENLRLSFMEALEQKQNGQAIVVVSEELGDGLKAVNIGVNYLVDKFAEARDNERDTLLNKLGIMTANTDKKERVQSAEVNASIGQATDYIYLLIDTFNKQCESYNVPYEMKLNGSLEEIYLNDDEINDVDVNDVEREQNIND